MNTREYKTLLAGFVLSLLSVSPVEADTYPTKLLDHEQQIDAIIQDMTLEEKIAMLHGKNMFSSAGIPRLGIADMEYADGPFGIREEMEPHGWNSIHLSTDSATFFPTGSALAATWSTDWAYAYGRGMSREARLRGKDMILGPAINIQRIPTGGRTYEYLSEDPLLSGMLAVAYTRGAQEEGTAVCLKHYALNNQEDYRGFVDVRISDRAMHEIYLRPFEMAVREADAWGMMAAYNKVNGRWCSENETLLNTILRKQWGFPGMVISDWGGVHSTVDAVTAGMNVEMPGQRFLGQALLDSVKSGKVSEAIIDQRVREILRVRLTVKPIAPEVANRQPVGNAEEMATALEIARRSIVLMKNDGLLPIDTRKVHKIAVIGENAVTKMALGGVGAGVKTRCEITPLEGLQKALDGKVEITYSPGYKSYDRSSRNQRQSPQQEADRQLMAQAVETAKGADLVIFFAGDNREVETEGSDRKSIALPSGQDEVAQALAKVSKRLVTVVVSGGPVDISTVNEVSGALLASWFNGSMGGQALAEILTGRISPSGKLPMTWPKALEDVPAYDTGSYPQNIENNQQGDIFVDITQNRSNERRQQLIANYTEEDLVGYRWYDCKEVPVAYPFGFGLSYAQFQYSDIDVRPSIEGLDVHFTLTNTSGIDAEEVAQVYVSRPASHIERPVKELKGFQRILLKAGERKMITIPIRRSDLCHWDESAQTWMLEPGKLYVQVGGSSDMLPLSKETDIKYNDMTNEQLKEKLALALEDMKVKAIKMGIEGVAAASVLNQNDTVNWLGEMKVVGSYCNQKDGFNLVAIAWSKCGEVIATQADSGDPNHKTITGELGYAGGAYDEYQGFKLAFAFSGATSEEDLVVAKYGIEKMKGYLSYSQETDTTTAYQPLATPLKKDQFIQVTIVVSDIRRATKAWAALLGVPEPEIWVNHLESNAEYPYTYRGRDDKPCDLQMCVFEMGNWVLELHQVGNEPSTFREFQNKHGQGVHHLGFEVGNARDEVIKELQEMGFDTGRTIGIYPGSSWTIVDSEDVLGVNLNIKPKR